MFVTLTEPVFFTISNCVDDAAPGLRPVKFNTVGITVICDVDPIVTLTVDDDDAANVTDENKIKHRRDNIAKKKIVLFMFFILLILLIL
jgi:hypothetical protein